MTLVNRSMRTQSIYVAQWLLQDDLVRIDERIESPVLGAGGDIAFECQIGQESLQFLLAGGNAADLSLIRGDW